MKNIAPRKSIKRKSRYICNSLQMYALVSIECRDTIPDRAIYLSLALTTHPKWVTCFDNDYTYGRKHYQVSRGLSTRCIKQQPLSVKCKNRLDPL